MFGVSDVGGRKLLFNIYPNPPLLPYNPPSAGSPLQSDWKSSYSSTIFKVAVNFYFTFIPIPPSPLYPPSAGSPLQSDWKGNQEILQPSRLNNLALWSFRQLKQPDHFEY